MIPAKNKQFPVPYMRPPVAVISCRFIADVERVISAGKNISAVCDMFYASRSCLKQVCKMKPNICISIVSAIGSLRERPGSLVYKPGFVVMSASAEKC